MYIKSIEEFIDCFVRDADDEIALRDALSIVEIDKNDYHITLDTGSPYDSIDFKVKLYETCILIYANKYADNLVENDDDCVVVDSLIDVYAHTADEILQAANEFLIEIGRSEEHKFY